MNSEEHTTHHVQQRPSCNLFLELFDAGAALGVDDIHIQSIPHSANVPLAVTGIAPLAQMHRSQHAFLSLWPFISELRKQSTN